MTKEPEYNCCANCKCIVSTPKGNRYNDMEHFCLATGYLLSGIHKDITKVKRFSPGGKELICKYERKETL